MPCVFTLDVPEGHIARDFVLSLVRLVSPTGVRLEGFTVIVEDYPNCNAFIDALEEVMVAERDPCKAAGVGVLKSAKPGLCNMMLPHRNEFGKLGEPSVLRGLSIGVKPEDVPRALEFLRRLSRGESIDSPRAPSRPLLRLEYREYTRGFGGTLQTAGGRGFAVALSRQELSVSLHAQVMTALGFCVTLAAVEGNRTRHVLLHEAFANTFHGETARVYSEVKLLYRRFVETSDVVLPSVYYVAAAALLAARTGGVAAPEDATTLTTVTLSLTQRSASLQAVEETPLHPIYSLLIHAGVEASDILASLSVLWDVARRNGDAASALNGFAHSLYTAALTGSTDYMLAAIRAAHTPVIQGSSVLDETGSTCIAAGICTCTGSQRLRVHEALTSLERIAYRLMEEMLVEPTSRLS